MEATMFTRVSHALSDLIFNVTVFSIRRARHFVLRLERSR